MPTPDLQQQLASARDALDDTFTLQGLRARQPRTPAGGYVWTWRGPRGDPEWAWFFNRHHWLPSLHAAYSHFNDNRYLDALLATLDDWIASNPPPGRVSFSAAWRPLEAARRLLSSWLPLWPLLLDEPAFTPRLRARLAASLRDHARHLRHHHARGGNHLVTEMLALVRVALLLRDEPASPRWLGYALARLERAYHDQVYPDGAYKELSTHYHRVVAQNFSHLRAALADAGRPDLASRWTPRVEQLWRYLRSAMTPSGANPLNNDSDLDDLAAALAEFAPHLLAAAAPPPAHHPFAGHTFFRSPSPDGEHWAFFDSGPRGTAHDHADRLSFTLSVGSADFLVDNGRHTYKPGPFRDYFAGPAAHNIVLLDGVASDQGPARRGRAPRRPGFVTAPEFTLAWDDSSFARGGNPRAADWRRLVLHVHALGWVVVDRLVAFGPCEFTTLWHWHPCCGVRPPDAPGAPFLVDRDDLGLSLRLLGPATSSATVVRGRETPSPQGWFSPRYNRREPAPCLAVRQRTDAPLLNLWIFQPVGAPALRVVRLTAGSLQITAEPLSAPVEFHPDKPPAAALLSTSPA